MSLINCKECGENISDKAKSCPKCGAPVHVISIDKGPSMRAMLFVIFLGVLVFGFVVNNFSDVPEEELYNTTQHSSENNDGVNRSQNEKETTTNTKNTTTIKKEVKVVNWLTHEDVDSVTGKKVSYLLARSKNSVKFDYPYNDENGSFLTLIFRKGSEGFDAYVVISKGQIICGYQDCSIRTRGDDDKVRVWHAVSEASGKSNMIFFKNPKGFESYIKKNKNVVIGVTFYQAGEQGFNFDTYDYPQRLQGGKN
ncbi:zinc ribbon domain-containing protein [Entomohabitans teleogrylli]|uniref:zinc ribbon domain-containing protein n=1 Tax=Entomohabitans teleogrylli TaxID=1384589 RepID=UPI0008FC4CC9|nr:zinc ribbon domain-containing protein [Entomohabitans teleogrylli]